MERICIIVPYFGRWPQWLDLYLASCARNPTVDWLLVTDCPHREHAPANVRFEFMTWSECVALIRETCGVVRGPATPYKLCDYKMTFGDVFARYIAGYDYWGFGDVDVAYGDLHSFLTPPVLDHDLITFNRTHVAGHFTLLRNKPECTLAYRRCEAWRAGADDPKMLFLDENAGYYGIDDVYAVESYNTPLSPYIPWTDGDFLFPRYWYCVDGRLYNSLNGDRHFMYLHFMRYKYRWAENLISNIVHLSVNAMAGDWKLGLDGFWLYSRADHERERGASIRVELVVAEATGTAGQPSP